MNKEYIYQNQTGVIERPYQLLQAVNPHAIQPNYKDPSAPDTGNNLDEDYLTPIGTPDYLILEDDHIKAEVYDTIPDHPFNNRPKPPVPKEIKPEGTPTQSKPTKKKSKPHKIIAIVFGILIAIVISGVLVYFLVPRNENNQDIGACMSNPCLNGGNCSEIVKNEYTCTCHADYTGSHCETDVSECEEEPCLNGGSCIDGINSYTCLCLPGYTGINCQGETAGYVYISLHLIAYHNEASLANDGQLCDSDSNPCDHYFKICLDKVDEDYSMTKCSLGTLTTGYTLDQNVIAFTNDIGGTSNPILFSGIFIRFTGDIQIKVEVWESDDYMAGIKQELVEFLKETVGVVPGIREGDARETTAMLQGRTRLVATVKAWCADDWYGEDCSVYCSLSKIDEDAGYKCNENGEIIHIPG